MASKTGIGIFSKLLTKTSNRLNETLGILKDKMLSARVIDISLNSNSPLWEQTGEWKGIGTIQFQLVDSPTSESTISSSKLYDLVGTEINLGDLCDDGSQMRPHIVWFGEPVPMMEKAIDIVQESDYLIIIGTSLMVYPASGLIDYARVNVKKFYIDPDAKSNLNRNDIELISMRASEGVKSLVKRLME